MIKYQKTQKSRNQNILELQKAMNFRNARTKHLKTQKSRLPEIRKSQIGSFLNHAMLATPENVEIVFSEGVCGTIVCKGCCAQALTGTSHLNDAVRYSTTQVARVYAKPVEVMC